MSRNFDMCLSDIVDPDAVFHDNAVRCYFNLFDGKRIISTTVFNKNNENSLQNNKHI